ncbi:MAG: hypothetical protein QNJ32_08810 [Xenococcaceae cyanobacterium MO_167.B27]|nr:hypothetical protein [Xenococcaceae cyanobacterium MO_167.B27]
MSHFASNRSSPLFSSGQIVALDHCHGILYGEIIQTVPQRQMCWVRGIALSLKTKHFMISFERDAENNIDSNNLENCNDSTTVLVDLYRNVDLLFPVDLFRVAVDTEIMPILSKIDPYPYSGFHDITSSRQYLNWFLKEIWQTNQDKFQV